MDVDEAATQEAIQSAHRDRARAAVGAEIEPLYGLEPIAGGEGEAPIEESAAEEAAAEAGRPGEVTGLNMTWGIILGGVLLLCLVVLLLYFGVGATYQADAVTHYPIK